AAVAPTPGSGQEAVAGPGLRQPAASAGELPPSPANSFLSPDTSAAGARPPAAATPGTRRLSQSERPPPPSPSPGISSAPLAAPNPGGNVPPLGLVTTNQTPASNHLPTAGKAARSPPPVANGVVTSCHSLGVTTALHLSTGTPSGTGKHLATSGAAGTIDPSALTVPPITSINSPCNPSQNGTLNPHSVSQAGILVDRVSTPTITLQRPPMHTVIASNAVGTALSQNGHSKVSAPGPLQVGERTGICQSATVTELVNQIAAVSRPISTPTSTNTNSTSQTKLVLHAQSQPVTLSLLNNPAASVTMANTSSNQLQCTVTNSLPLASLPVSINAAAKSAVNMIARPHVGITKVITSAPGIIHASATQAQPPRPGIGPSHRIAAPQFIICPPQQPTVQLASGFTIPPGMILVRTEGGQLVIVPQQALAQAHAQIQAQAQRPGSISPKPPAPTSGATFCLASAQPAVTISSIRPGYSVQAKVIQPAAPAVTTASVTASQPVYTAAPTLVTGRTSAPQTVYTTTLSGAGGHPTVLSRAPTQIAASPQPQSATKTQVQVHLPVIPSSPLPGTTPTVAQVSMASRSAPLARAGQEMQENVKKCKNFLATLIKLASHSGQSADTSRNVKSLVQDLLDSKIEPEEFTNRLQSELKSSPQPYLVPFLKKSLPALRQSLVHNQQCILQVNQQPQQPQVEAPAQTTSAPQSTVTVNAVVAGPSVRIRQPISNNGVSGTNAVTEAQINAAQQGRSTHLIVQSPVPTVKRQPGPGAQVRLPVVITPSIRA
ncbi:hypothetical protein scyTo_0015989, partial [Scyliorhinus torazame]|nr:hypothetical protein [Scyliorhinus torazame]